MNHQPSAHIFHSHDNITCPFCQQQVLDWSQEQYIQPCEHTLYIAIDLGFEYVADQFEQSLQKTVDEIHAQDNIDMSQELAASTLADIVQLQGELGINDMKRYLGFCAVA